MSRTNYLLWTVILTLGVSALAGETPDDKDKRMPVSPRIRFAKKMDPNLPRVLLIGDSICSGYQKRVRQLLQGKANVDYWVTGANLAKPTLEQLQREAIKQGPYDVIHFNIGLHGLGKRIASDRYEPLMRKYIKVWKTYSKQSQLIWASTTPTRIEENTQLDPEETPLITRRNAIAADVMKECGITVNDLYGLVVNHLDLGAKDGVHWTGAGYSLMAKQIAVVITDTLKSQQKKQAKSQLQFAQPEIDFQVNPNGSLFIQDKANNTQWGSNIPGWVTLRIENEKVKIPLTTSQVTINQTDGGASILFNGLWNDGQKIDFSMNVKVRSSEGKIDIEIESLKSKQRFERLEYPASLMTVKSGVADGAIIIPRKQGIMIPSRYDNGFMRYGQNVWNKITEIDKTIPFESYGINMPWFGATLGKASLFAYIATSPDAQLHVVGNAVVSDAGEVVGVNRERRSGTRLSSLAPIWDSQKGELGYVRKMTLEVVAGGYVGMAKRYLDYSKQTGRYVTFKDKIKQNPNNGKIIGAPDVKIYVYTNRLNDPYYKAGSGPVLNGYSVVNTTFEQVGDIAAELKEMGVENCLILLGGWNRMGYDREHVDMWPPAAGAGGIEGLAKACEKIKDLGYLFALHDNYSDFYLDAPTYDDKFIVKMENGSVKRGGVWDGGPCDIICTKKRRDLLNRNLDLVLKSVDLNAYYFDVITAAYLMECSDETHTMTRSEDLGNRKKVINTVRDRGLVFGGEMGTDWATETAVFFEGLHGGGVGYHRGVTYEMGIDIPLYHLVYHDCVVAYWQHGTPFGREDHANHVLHDMICGQPSSWSIVQNQFDDLKGLIKETYDLLGTLHKKTAHYALANHEILTADFTVQRSTFSDGTIVLVNYSIRTRTVDGKKIPPKGFEIQYPGEDLVSGSFSHNVQ